MALSVCTKLIMAQQMHLAVTDNDGLLSNLATNCEKVHVPTTGYTCTAANQTTTESLFMILRKLLY